jgi:methyl-accepting chemotaxis protein
MKSKSKLTLIYSLTILALLPIFGLAGYYIYESRENVVKEKIKKLHEIAKSKQVTLENHLGNYIKSVNSFAKNERLIEGIKKNDFNNGSYEYLRKFQEEMWGMAHHVFVADPEGNIILSPHHQANLKSTHLNHSIAKSKYFKPSLNETQVTDFYGFEESTHYHQLVMVPIKDNGKTLGVVIAEVTIQYFIDLLKKDFELGKTGTIYLSTLDKKKVVHLKKDEILDVEAPLLTTALSRGVAYGENKSFGGNVLASYIKSERFPWVLAIEISKDEVLAPVNKMTNVVSGIFAAFIVLFLFVFKFIIKLLEKPVQDVTKTLEQISSEASEHSSMMKDQTSGLVDDAMRLAEALVENQGQLEQVVGQIKDETGTIKSAAEKSLDARNIANSGNEVVQDMTKNINLSSDENANVRKEIDNVLNDITQIVESIKLIQEKTTLINDIVFQTKLLSFNASVEAARAGEHGKGFAVVAEEVGNLAAMSGKAAVEIHEMIDDSVKKVEVIVEKSNKSLKNAIDLSSEKISHTSESIERCRALFSEIIKNVNDISESIGHVSRNSQEKVTAIGEVNDRFIGLKEVSEKSTQVAHKVGSLTDRLQQDSDELVKVSKDLSQKFAA